MLFTLYKKIEIDGLLSIKKNKTGGLLSKIKRETNGLICVNNKLQLAVYTELKRQTVCLLCIKRVKRWYTLHLYKGKSVRSALR